uniref:Uncharacterized protein n=1 Tax=Arundo donax TaxID=35708 RepID=A0A0A9E011_ARUDO
MQLFRLCFVDIIKSKCTCIEENNTKIQR